jgi:hypothetical protein
VELEPADQKLEFGLWMGVAGEQVLAPVGGRQMDVESSGSGFVITSPGRVRIGEAFRGAALRDLHLAPRPVHLEEDEQVFGPRSVSTNILRQSVRIPRILRSPVSCTRS